MSVAHVGRNKWFTYAMGRGDAYLVLCALLGHDLGKRKIHQREAALRLIDYLEVAFHGEKGNPSYWDARRQEAAELGAPSRPGDAGRGDSVGEQPSG